MDEPPPQRWSGRGDEDKITAPTGNSMQVLEPVASQYTDMSAA